jgi:nucleotide-binding universal stress UspA family protein
MTRNITVGIDGSEQSLIAAEWGVREALLRDLPLHLVHGREQAVGPAGAEDGGRAADRQEQWAEARLMQASVDLRYRHPALDIVVRRLPGPPVAALAAAAEDADVLVLGSHGTGGDAGSRVGSVTRATVCAVEQPVVVVRCRTRECCAELAGPNGAWSPIHEVLLGTDLAASEEDVLAFAFDAALRRRCTLRVLYATAGNAVGAAGPVDDPCEQSARELNDVLVPWRRKYPTVSVLDCAVRGPAAEWLTESTGDTGLVVVGRHVTEGVEACGMGPVARAVVEHGDAPVAVIAHR